MNWIAKKISETRKIKGLTQEELAEQAKINYPGAEPRSIRSQKA